MPDSSLPYLGFGLGLRPEHYHDILSSKPAVDWFEILTENYLVPGGKPLYYLDKIRQDYPMVMHGVSLSIGGTDPLDKNYLQQVFHLANRIEPHWISDHLCWTGVNGTNAHDLLPLPYTEEAINHIVERVKQVQDVLKRPLLLENVSSYITYQHSVITEWEFYTEICQRADCLMLLDINNVYVSAVNHSFDPLEYLNYIPTERVQQHHLAGHMDHGDYLVDTHDHDVPSPVWDLYATALEHFGAVSVMIERDDDIPPLQTILLELQQAKALSQKVLKS